MPRYLASIRHQSISHAPVLEATNLPTIKCKASRAFGDGFRDHEIVIVEEADDRAPLIIARRRVGDRRWVACQVEA